jgi:hypothetical protein
MEAPSKKVLRKLDKNPEWRKTVLSLYDQGASDREVMRELSLTPGAWDTLYKDVLESDFQELVDFGRAMSHAWWESQGRINLKTKGFNTSLWTINMKNRFGWSEKTEQSLTQIDFENMDDSVLIKKITELNKKMDLGRGKG